MDVTSKILGLFATLFLVLSLIFNLMPSWPRFPWDIQLRKGPIKFYFPLFSSLILSIVLTVMFNYFKN